MGLFTKTTQEEGVIHHALKFAFDHIKRDVSYIFQWLDYFHKKHQSHDEKFQKIEQQLNKLSQMENQLSYVPNHEEIKQIVHNHSTNDVRLAQIHERIEVIYTRLAALEAQKQDRRTSLKERLVKKISKNSKDYIKSVILSLIRKYERISAPQLKEILVEEQGLCSKSSFYRLLVELEQENNISSIQTGKEKMYISKTQIIN